MNRTFLKFATSTSAVAISAMLSVTPVFAAESIEIDGNAYYTPGVSGEGSNGGTWNWQDTDNLAINNYDGTNIVSYGDINIQVTGDNTVTSSGGASIKIRGGDLSMTGDGTLTTSQGPNISSVYVNNGDINVEGITLKTDENGAGCFVRAVDGDIAIKDATFEGTATNYMVLAENGNITIDNVNTNATAGETVFLANSRDENAESSINIVNTNGFENYSTNSYDTGTYQGSNYKNGQAVYNADGTLATKLTFVQANPTKKEETKPEEKKEETKTEEKTSTETKSVQHRKDVVNTGIFTDMGLYLTGTLSSVGCLSILSVFKRRNRK